MEKPRILLFGRTGSGKSTVANMLARGHLHPPLLFQTSSGARGQTLRTQREECEDMVIVDTVGLGESDLGSVSHQEAQNILYDFFMEIGDIGFHHFAFVRRWSRNDALDEQLWGFFRQAFKGAEQNFVVIFTGVGKLQEKELEKPETKEVLLRFYHPCQQWIYVNFGGQGKKLALDRSLTNLQVKLRHFRGAPAAPEVCQHLRLGRILFLGTEYGSIAAQSIVASLLVNCHPADFVRQQERKQRRWQVVNLPALDDYSVIARQILSTLTDKEGFSHVVLVHDSRCEHGSFVKNLWKMMLSLFHGDFGNERLMVVIAQDSKQQGALALDGAWFPGCQNLVHLDLPLNESLMEADPDHRLHTAQQILERALQIKEASTFFHINKSLSNTDMNRLLRDFDGLDPGIKVFTASNSQLSMLSRAYKKLVSREEQTQLVCLRNEEGRAADPDFCQSSQLVMGYCSSFSYLRLNVMEGRPVMGIHVSVTYEDTGYKILGFKEVPELVPRGKVPERIRVYSWAELAVISPRGEAECIRVYSNSTKCDEVVTHSVTIREPSFLENIRPPCHIALFLSNHNYSFVGPNGSAADCFSYTFNCFSYTFDASLQILRE